MSTQQDSRAGTSLQLGVQKYLYTGYFVVGCLVAYIVHQIIEKAWGEGHDAIVTAVSVVVGIAAVVFAWRNNKIRTLAQETIDELAAVSWPSREETYTATVIVLATSVVATALIFSMDRFWAWFTDRIFS